MSEYSYLTAPAAPSTITSPAQLEQLVNAAVLNNKLGFTYYSLTAPDVITYPALKRFLWIDLSGPEIVQRVYDEDQSSWIQQIPEDGSITTAMLADLAVTIAKLSADGGSDGDIFRIVNGVVVFDSPANLFTTSDPLAVNVLAPEATAGVYVLVSGGGTPPAWSLLSTLIGAITIQLAKISTTGALDNQVLSFLSSTLGYRYIETLLRDGQTPITKLAAAAAGYILRMKMDGTAWEAVAPSALTQSVDSGGQLMPTVVNTPVTFTHNLATTALQVTVFGVCVADNNGYVIGDIVPISAFVCDDNGGGVSVSGAPALIYKLTNTTINMYLMADAGTVFKVRDVSTGINAGALTDPTKWNWRAILTKIA